MESIFILCGGFEWKNELVMNKLAKFVLDRFSKPKISFYCNYWKTKRWKIIYN